jgi:hypothetical protein
MFNKPYSIASLNHTSRGQLVDHLGQTQVAQESYTKIIPMTTDFGHTLLFYLKKTWIFNKPTSDASLKHTSRGQSVENQSHTSVAQQTVTKILSKLTLILVTLCCST